MKQSPASAAPGGKSPEPRRNARCPCGSGRKFKQCCGTSPRDRPEPAGLVNISSAPPPARVRQLALERAARLRERGQWPAALALLQGYALRYPDDAFAQHDLGATFLHLRRLPSAIAHLGRAAMLDPDFVKAHYHLGLACQQEGRDTEAISAFRRAVSLAPRHADAQARLGDLLGAKGERAAAAECYRRAGAAAPNTTEGRLAQAKALLSEEKFPDAERLLRRIIALDPRSSAAHWILGRTLAALGQFGEAVVRLERAKALAPGEVSIHYDLVTAKRIEDADRPQIAEMLAALGRPGLADRDRIGLEYGLGKAFDDLGDYHEAIRHFDAANRLNNSLVRFDRAGIVSDNDRMLARFVPSLGSQPRHAAAEDETPILIVGMPRSGTTLVEQILSAHPKIGAGGEQDFWSKTAAPFAVAAGARPTAAELDRAADDYLALLRRLAPRMPRVTDKMPGNFRWLGLIHLALPRARIIHCGRDPVDTCLSNFFAWFGALHSYSCSRADLVFYYREYLRVMAYWRTMLPPERLFEIDYETLTAERERVSREMIAFIGLEWDERCLSPERNDRVIYTSSKWQARQPVYRTSVQRWRNYEPWLGELRELMPGAPA